MGRVSDRKYRITICNWENHQTKMRGKGQRKRRRSWVAISVDLFSDPEYLSLDATHSRLWLGLLLHSGKVGPSFDMSPTYARHLFDLRRSCDFRVLENQGFIELTSLYIQDKGQENTTDKLDKQLDSQVAARKEKKSPESKSKTDPTKWLKRFDDFWDAWPKKLDKQAAMKKWASMKLDPVADLIIENVKFRVESDIGWRDPQYIPYAAKFLFRRRWEDEMIQTQEHTKDEAYAERGRRTVENAERAEAEAAGETYDPDEGRRSTLFGSQSNLPDVEH